MSRSSIACVEAYRIRVTGFMTHSWAEYRERGSSKLMMFAVRLILRFGRGFGRLLMYPISLYFFLNSRGTARHSKEFLAAVLNRKPKIRERFNHYYVFATTIMDRLFFFTNRFDDFDISIVGRGHVERYVQAGTGCILVGSHLGSFEVLRAMGSIKEGIAVKALYNEHNSDQFDAILTKLNPAAAEQLIKMGEPDTMLRVREFIESGGLVGILGDRANKGGKVVSVEFLGKRTLMPIWPFRLCAVIGCPIVLFYGLFHGDNNYEIVFEPFAKKIERADIDSDTKVSGLVQAYANRLEWHCRRAPGNWFNFFDYWSEAEAEDGVYPADRG